MISQPKRAAIEICTRVCNTGAPYQLGTAGPATGRTSEAQQSRMLDANTDDTNVQL